MSHPKVFISYSHDSAQHKTFVRELADRLCNDGIDCDIDQYLNGAPPERWQPWMEHQIERADFVLIVCTKLYLKRYRSEDTEGGRGVTFEGLIISQILYKQYYRNAKFIPVLPENGQMDHVPTALQDFDTYTLPCDYIALYRVLANQPATPKPKVGEVVDLSKTRPVTQTTKHSANGFQQVKRLFSRWTKHLASQPAIYKPTLGKVVQLPRGELESASDITARPTQPLQPIESVTTAFLQANPILGQRLAQMFGLQADVPAIHEALSKAIHTAQVGACFERMNDLIVTLEQARDRRSIQSVLSFCNDLLPSLIDPDEVKAIQRYLSTENSGMLTHPSATNAGIEGSMAAYDQRPAEFRLLHGQYGRELRGINQVHLPDSAGGELDPNAADNEFSDSFYQKYAGFEALKKADKLQKQGQQDQASLIKQESAADQLRLHSQSHKTQYAVLDAELPPVLHEIKQACPYLCLVKQNQDTDRFREEQKAFVALQFIYKHIQESPE